MATIQVRDLPEDAYETLRRRARREGRSLQSYMREQVLALAARPTKAELVERIEDGLARWGGSGASAQTLADGLTADRR